MAPRDGLRPTRPQQAAGTLIEPAASVAWASATIPAATAAAAPPEEPPGVRLRSSGLRAIGPITGSLASDRPNSGTVLVPNSTRPAARMRPPSSESALSGKSGKALEPQIIGRPAAVAPRSFIRNGTPTNG